MLRLHSIPLCEVTAAVGKSINGSNTSINVGAGTSQSVDDRKSEMAAPKGGELGRRECKGGIGMDKENQT